MKRFNYIFLFLLVNTSIFAQKTTSFTVISDKSYQTVVDVTIGEIKQFNIVTPIGNAVKISIDKGNALLEKGSPDLPKLAFSVIIPNQKNTSLSIIESGFIEYQNVLVAPSKGKIYRNEIPSTIPYTYNDNYSKNDFYPSTLTHLNKPFILRDFRGQTIEINPVQYNPITKVLRVYTHFKLKLEYSGTSTENTLFTTSSPQTIVEEFNTIYANRFINYQASKTRYTPISQQGSMLIICPNIFLTQIAPYNKWKQMKGYKTYLVDADTITGGITEASIYNLAKSYYTNHQIAYITIVGDHGNIPTMLSTNIISNLMGASDNAYGYMTPNDHYPDIIVGRLSGEIADDITTQVTKTIQYEKFPNTASNWMQKQIGIASDQGPGDDNQYDYEQVCDILDSNKNQYNYINDKGYFDGNQTGCNDDAGNPNNLPIINEFNNGIGLINYCGHGSVNSFSTTGFSNSDMPSLTNTNGNWPFIVSVACYNGEFMFTTCFAEALLRSKDASNNPSGAIATVMSTILQSWDPPMQGQDEINALLRGARSNNLKTTFGCLVANGNSSVIDQYNTSTDPQGGDEISDTWTVFGDPSLEVRTKNEGTITCQYSGFIQQNSTTFNIGCNTEGATIGLYYKGKYWASSTVVGGIASFNFDPLDVLDSLLITATKQNYIPHNGYTMVVNYPAAVNTTTLQQNIHCFPNPFNNEINIFTSSNIFMNEIRLIDMSGKICFTTKPNAINYQLNTQSISKGIYQLEIFTNQGIYREKFVK